jgi:acyl dehydratase
MGNYLDDFSVGEVISHSLSKTIFESDNNLFSLLTMNHHPLHLNDDFSSKAQHGKIVVVGTLVLSLVVGITVQDISGKAIANLDYEKITHDRPVFIGDTIYAETEILDIRLSKTKPDRGIVYIETRAFNQQGKKVLTLRRHILIPKRKM